MDKCIIPLGISYNNPIIDYSWGSGSCGTSFLYTYIYSKNFLGLYIHTGKTNNLRKEFNPKICYAILFQ